MTEIPIVFDSPLEPHLTHLTRETRLTCRVIAREWMPDGSEVALVDAGRYELEPHLGMRPPYVVEVLAEVRRFARRVIGEPDDVWRGERRHACRWPVTPSTVRYTFDDRVALAWDRARQDAADERAWERWRERQGGRSA